MLIICKNCKLKKEKYSGRPLSAKQNTRDGVYRIRHKIKKAV
jgi:hypothetical protein